MTTIKEEGEIINYFKKRNALKKLVLYACTSGYPVPFDETFLLEIKRLKKDYGKKIKSIGFSGHHNGIAIDMAAIALGAEWIERHFTLDRTWKGTDHAASLEPDGMRKLVRNSFEVVQGMIAKSGKISRIEKITAKFAFSSVVSIQDIKKGEKFTLKNIWVKRPGTGFYPAYKIKEILGKKAKKKIIKDKFITKKDV